MPFDSSPVELNPIDKLIQALRGPEPEDWDYNIGCKCAMGMAARLKINHREIVPNLDDEMHIFYGWPDRRRKHPGFFHEDVRPRHVAAALEHYRDTGEALSPIYFIEKERGP